MVYANLNITDAFPQYPLYAKHQHLHMLFTLLSQLSNEAVNRHLQILVL